MTDRDGRKLGRTPEKRGDALPENLPRIFSGSRQRVLSMDRRPAAGFQDDRRNSLLDIVGLSLFNDQNRALLVQNLMISESTSG